MEKDRALKLLIIKCDARWGRIKPKSQGGMRVTAVPSVRAPNSTEVHVKVSKHFSENPVQIPRGAGHPASFSTDAAGCSMKSGIFIYKKTVINIIQYINKEGG